MASTSAKSLGALPNELLLLILSFSDYPARVAVAQVTKHLRSLIDLEEPTSPEKRLAFLIVAETWSRYAKKFACSKCLKLRPAVAFADKQTKAKRRKGGPDSNRRFCVDCGVKLRLYQPGQTIEVRNYASYICGLCWRRCDSGRYCVMCAACQGCMISRKWVPLFGRVVETEDSCPRCARPWMIYSPRRWRSAVMQICWPH
ncbi:hypothetical protein BJX68DRAFT_249967 [Aspergillus pseudodeflectus]|uniref:F-box domain-containing protein n=1 Tax=Aspergillus pseudodeflectus TaxID=176178 RepID=A0ABR4JAW4_9EURO